MDDKLAQRLRLLTDNELADIADLPAYSRLVERELARRYGLRAYGV